MNQTIREHKALKSLSSPVFRAPARPVIRSLSIGGWCVASLLIAMAVVGIARWWVG